jgi:Rrf2 family protein
MHPRAPPEGGQLFGREQVLKFSKKMLYAIEAVVDIAYNSGGRPVQIRDVTSRQGVPQRYLEQVMQRLVKAGILRGVRGPRGGYLLARERSKISVGDIARVAMELGGDGESELPDDVAVGPIGDAVIRPLWGEFQDQILVMMDQITVEDLTNRAYRAGVPSDIYNRINFSI